MRERSILTVILIVLISISTMVLGVSATSTTVKVDPPSTTVNAGDYFSVNVLVTDIFNFTSWQFKLYYLKIRLNCSAITEGPFLKTAGLPTYFGKTINNNFNTTHGFVSAYCTLLGNSSVVNGSGVIATVTFRAMSGGTTPLHFAEILLGDEKIPPQPIPYTVEDGTVNVVAGTSHDVAVTNIVPSKSIVGRNYTCNVAVTTENHGGYPETYNVALHANETEIATQQITVPSGAVTTVNFTWNTSDHAFGGYVIWAYAAPVPGETDISDNNYTNGQVLVLWPGDIQLAYRKIDMRDIAFIAKRFSLPPSDPLWDPNADVNNDGKVDMKDIALVAKYFALNY